jgi:hypothetical protein
MRRALATVLVLLLSLTAAPADAVRVEGTTIILPVIGRFPGDGGTQWRTDVFIFNAYGDPTTVTLKFYDGGTLRQFTSAISPYNSLSLPDVVLGTFGRDNGGGPLEIESTTRIEARARIYNTGNPAGQFGQSVLGIAKDRLSRQSSLYSLSGNGSRVNVGVMNPNAGRSRSRCHPEQMRSCIRRLRRCPHTYRQFSNIFTLVKASPLRTACACRSTSSKTRSTATRPRCGTTRATRRSRSTAPNTGREDDTPGPSPAG